MERVVMNGESVTHGMTRTVLMIAGMHDHHCREKIEAALEAVAGVKDVCVNLYRAQAVVFHERWCKAEGLARIVTDCGYLVELKPCEDSDSYP